VEECRSEHADEPIGAHPRAPFVEAVPGRADTAAEIRAKALALLVVERVVQADAERLKHRRHAHRAVGMLLARDDTHPLHCATTVGRARVASLREEIVGCHLLVLSVHAFWASSKRR